MRPLAPRTPRASLPAGPSLGLLFLGFFPVGCDAPDVATSAPEPTVADSAGVQILRFPASALEVRAPRQLAPEPSVRIGVVEGAAEYQWTRPTAALRLPDGGFAVAEGTPAEIRVFDAGGSFVRRIGRPGDGPGEFRSPQALAAAPAPDGEEGLVAWDLRHRRRSHFRADGTLLSEATLQELSPLRSISRVLLLPDGRLMVIGGTGGPDAVANRGQAREPLEIRAIEAPTGAGTGGGNRSAPAGPDRSAAGGPESLRIGPLLGTTQGDEREVITESDAGGNMMSISISSQWYWGRLYTWATPTGVWAADRVGMEVRHYRADGGLDRVIRVDGTGPRATRALVDSFEAAEVARWERQMGDDLTEEIRTMIREHMADRDYPETFPAMDAVFADVHGNPWIGLPNPPSPSLMTSAFPEVPRWLVFGGAPGSAAAAAGSRSPPAGTSAPPAAAAGSSAPAVSLHLLGVIHLPPGSHPLWADGDGVLLIRIDPDLGVPYIEWFDWVDRPDLPDEPDPQDRQARNTMSPVIIGSLTRVHVAPYKWP